MWKKENWPLLRVLIVALVLLLALLLLSRCEPEGGFDSSRPELGGERERVADALGESQRDGSRL